MKEIQLNTVKPSKNTGKYFALIDDKDFERVDKFNWSVLFSNNRKLIYAHRKTSEGENVLLHRFILGIKEKSVFVDHRDGNGLNCQTDNIRVATNSQNQKNKRAYGVSKYLGVSKQVTRQSYTSKKTGIKKEYQPREYWVSHINNNGKSIHLGLFKTEIEAAKAYDLAAIKYHAEFANLNFK